MKAKMKLFCVEAGVSAEIQDLDDELALLGDPDEVPSPDKML